MIPRIIDLEKDLNLITVIFSYCFSLYFPYGFFESRHTILAMYHYTKSKLVYQSTSSFPHKKATNVPIIKKGPKRTSVNPISTPLTMILPLLFALHASVCINYPNNLPPEA